MRTLRYSIPAVLLGCGFALGLAAPAAAVDVAWITVHPGDNMPHADAVTAGFTMAPDIGYTNLLTANGHNVTRVLSSGTPDVNLLNTFDVVIVGRGVPSGDYETDPETAAWNSGIYAPLIHMGGYAIRNVRLGFTTGGTIPDTTGPINLTVTNPAHPIFAGIPLSGGTMVNPFADLAVSPVNAAVQRGISVNSDPVAGGGTVLATIPIGTPSMNGTVIGQWGPGANMNTSPVDVLAGHRLVFLSGSREADTVDSDTSGIFDLTANGQTMFLNAVNYMSSLGPVLPGDVNGNGVADIGDYTIIRNNFQGTGKTRAQGDLSGDGIVNFTDFRRWKNTQPAGALAGLEAALFASVPEPASAVLALLGAFAAIAATGRRRARQ